MMKKILSSKLSTLGLALLLVISTLGTAIVPAGPAYAEAQSFAEQEGSSVTQATYGAEAFAAAAQEPVGVAKAVYDTTNFVLKRGNLSDWDAIGLGRSGAKVPDSYRTALESKVKTANGTYLNVTDYARISLAVTAIGRDATSFAGYNLIERIYNSERMTNQGVNGPVYSLLAIDSGKYTIPDNARWTKDKLLTEILSKQNTDGGFGFGTMSDPDLTAMTLNALAAHFDIPEVKTAGERAISWLALKQKADGGYNSSSETVAQAIIGLTSAGTDPTGPNYTKEQVNLVDKLLTFSLSDGSFRHTITGGSNGMATEQALQALISYDLFLKGEKFYDFGQPSSQKPEVQVSIAIEGPEGPISQGNVQAPTALKALEEIAKANTIPLEIIDSSFGKYVAAINGISQGKYGGYDGWMFAVNKDGHWVVPDVGAGDYLLQTGEQVLFFYGDYSDTSLINSVTVNPAVPASGEAFTVKVSKNVTDWSSGEPKLNSVPAAGIQVAIGGETVTTNTDGIATFASGKAAGNYTVEVTGYRQGAVPGVVRTTIALKVVPEVQAYVAIEGPEGPIKAGEVQASNALKALQKLAQANNIPLGITSSSFGDYVSAINGIEQKKYGGYDGWMFAVYTDGHWVTPDVGAGDYLLQDEDEILFYYGDYGVTSLIHSIYVDPAPPLSGQPFTITVTKDVTDWSGDGPQILEVPAADVKVTIGGEAVTTNAEGEAAFTSGKAAGDHTVEVTGYQPNAVPSVVRATGVFTVNKTNDPSTPTPTKNTVTFLVEGDATKGTIVAAKTVTINSGDTPYTLLARQLGGRVIATGSGADLYVRSIDGLAEFDRGPQSGWMYSVNGVFPNYSAGIYTLRDGDTVAWRYTTNLGIDLGAPTGGSGEVPGGSGPAPGKGDGVVITPDNNLPVNQVGQTTSVSGAGTKMTAAEAGEIKKTLSANTVSLSQAITVGAAATLKDSAGEVELKVPAGAVSSTVTINVKEISSNRTELVSGLYEFTPDGTKFAKPVDLLIQVPVTTDYPANLVMAWLNKTTNQWIPVPTTVDAKTGIVTGKVSHFTDYAVIDRSLWEPQQEQLKKDIAGAAKYITSAATISDWQAIGLARSGSTVPASFLNGLKEQLAESKGEFRKVTDYERIALAAGAAGADPLTIGGYNLIEKIYTNANMTVQGSNGPIFALIALDSGAFSVPATAQWTREKLVDWLLKQQSKDGGFPLTAGGSSDIDITAMAVTALSSYKAQAEVNTAIDKALNWLSLQQLENGGYKLSGVENSESVSQVIIALSAVGTGPNDPRFVKAKGGLLSNLSVFRQADGGYAHAVADKTSNGMATEQALLALTAYDRLLNGKDKLYSFSAALVTPTPAPSVTFADEGQISAWALKSVHTAYDNKLMQGVSADSLIFAPKSNITRAQFAALLLRLTNNKPSDVSAAPVFSDVKGDAWYYGDVLKAKELGIIDGVSKTAFNPNGTITRQDMAVMIARAFKLEAPANQPSFKDQAKIGSYALTAVQSVSELGYMTGFNGSFDPSAPVTREMAAVVAVRLP